MDALAAFIYARQLVSEDLSTEEIRRRADLSRSCLLRLIDDLDRVGSDDDDERVQSVFYEAGKLHFANELRWWFRLLYQVLLLQDDGPRLGQFTRIMTPCWIQDRIRSTMEDHWAAKGRLACLD